VDLAWKWIAASTVLLIVGAVTLVGTLGFGALLVHGEAMGFCMSQQREGDFGREMVVNWHASLIPFGMECQLATESGRRVEFYDFGTGFVVAGLVVVSVAGVSLALAIARFRSLDLV
jgi:hypothetical protein